MNNSKRSNILLVGIILIFILIFVFAVKINFSDKTNILRSLASVNFIPLALCFLFLLRNILNDKSHRLLLLFSGLFLISSYITTVLYLFEIRDLPLIQFFSDGILRFFGFCLVPTMLLFFLKFIPYVKKPENRGKIIKYLAVIIIGGHLIFLLILIFMKWKKFFGL
jgi:hypothetical protein